MVGLHICKVICQVLSTVNKDRSKPKLIIIRFEDMRIKGFPHSSGGKESACNAGDPGSIPGSGRSSGEGIGYPLQYSGLQNSMTVQSMGSQRVGHDRALSLSLASM